MVVTELAISSMSQALARPRWWRAHIAATTPDSTASASTWPAASRSEVSPASTLWPSWRACSSSRAVPASRVALRESITPVQWARRYPRRTRWAAWDRSDHLAAFSPGAVQCVGGGLGQEVRRDREDRKSTRLNSTHVASSYADFCVE